MQTGYPLRLYANPVKLFLYLLGSAAFVLIGCLIFYVSLSRASVSAISAVFPIMLAGVTILFFGLCVLVFLIMILRYTVFRLPVLQIDAQGWSYKNPLGGKAQVAPWQNIGAIAVFRQKMPRNTMYYLVVYAKDPQQLPHHPRAEAFTERLFPSLSALMSGAVLSVPLNTVFARTTPANTKRLLERIVSACAHEIQFYRVQVSGELYDM